MELEKKLKISSNNILASIVCKTYNQEKYIEQTIESLLLQQTTFDFEILIHDDASTDETQNIIKRFAGKYPAKIFPFFEDENQFSKNINTAFNYEFGRAVGKYIAVCDGDDYWTDPLKLQKQVDFLQAEDDCNFVFTKFTILKKDKTFYSTFSKTSNPQRLLSLEELIRYKITPISSCIIFRKSALPIQNLDFLIHCFHGDWALLFIMNYQSKVGFLNEYMCVYREDVGNQSIVNRIVQFKRGLVLNKNLNRYTGYKYDYYLGNYEFHYKNISHAYLENNRLFYGIFYLFLSLSYSLYKNKISAFVNNNTLFIKHAFKLIIR